MPKSVPLPIRKTVEDAIGKIAGDPAFQAAVAKSGSSMAYQNAADFQAWWDKDTAAMEVVIKKIAASTPPQ